MQYKQFDISKNNKITIIDKKSLILLATSNSEEIKIAESKIDILYTINNKKVEYEILEKLINLEPTYQFDSHHITSLFQIINNNMHLQQELLKEQYKHLHTNIPKIAFLGPKGSYSHIAARKYANHYFNSTLEIDCAKFHDIVDKVKHGQADYALLPFENTSSGYINDVYDILQHTNLSIIGELTLPIEHCLLVNGSTNLQQIQTIYSHPQPFQQCSKFIHCFPHWKNKYTESTAAAMKKISIVNSPKLAALGSEAGGKLYGLQVLKRNLSNQQQNRTRFIILSRTPIKFSSHISAKTTLIISTKQQIGALVEILLILRTHNLIVSKLKNGTLDHNIRQKMFYIDIQAHLESENMQIALKKIRKLTHFLKILGCYPSENIVPI
ncbi:prephenate dehydratase domain-containing protein [Pantoea sp. Mhis]|uniref:prephenate dehydratase domain-containing protein n=1 Tax=Pantoea sp. Mhis TaxID=2576759 RepID=UPI00135954E1|nr:prephenate dehydratase domain-containing protein [Pantoea sp. Mhis]MXP56623.1 bifunctional chorismate mutase/prephenate dehydratase [Pantoea sp. Mhis]